MLEANAWRAVKHAGHHEAGGRLPPTYSCYCVRYCIIQDLLLMLYGAKKGNERREKHGPFCSHLSSVTAAAVFLDWRPEGRERSEMGRKGMERNRHGLNIGTCPAIWCVVKIAFYLFSSFLKKVRCCKMAGLHEMTR